MPKIDIEYSLSKLTKHTLVPIILWNKSEYQDLPRFGIVSVTDPESGQEKTIFLRKKMLTKIKNTFKKREDELEKLFLKYNSPAFFVNDNFIPLEMTKYFNEHYHA
jgi:hypothetical protein